MPDTMFPKAPPKAKPLLSPPARRTAAATDGAAFPVVALGASAGGLEACNKLLDALPAHTGMAFILVQHLDPTHRSLLVELLAEHTHLAVVQAVDGMPVEPEHLYVIPPGAYLSVHGGALRLSPPEMRGGAPRGARLPFDVLLHALAEEYGARAACVVLSGSGADGSAGLRAVKAAGGRVVVQDPAEADYDGMPRSAIATGDVDAVAPAAGIPAALSANVAAHAAETPPGPAPDGPSSPGGMPSGEAPPGDAPPGSAPGVAGSDPLSQVIALLRARTRHDFTPYKSGTLERRIERRMGMASLGRDGMGRYLDLLRRDAGELDLLAKDLLIHVTSFFRDPAAYACLAETVIPALLQGRPLNQPLRVWVAGCSTGEEAYSIVMLFREAMAAQRGGVEDAAGDAAGAEIKLQVFASDVDADAVAVAREGLYPASVAAEVSPERLARFFSKEDGHGYRVLPELRGAVVFTVQDLLSDPSFSRLDLVSCRNLMIYLGPEAQAKAATLFHFALKEGGFLLLGSAETMGEGDGRFQMMQKSARLYRHVGPKRPGDLSFAGSVPGSDGLRPARTGTAPAPSRPAALAELCRQTVLDLHAPAAVLCDARHECMYLLGPTDRYLQVPPGQATADLLAMARGTMRTRLRAALVQAAQAGARVTVPGGRLLRDGRQVPFSIDVQPLQHDGEALLLVCFVDAPAQAPERRTRAGRAHDGIGAPRDASHIAELELELELELEAVRAELEAGNRALEASAEDQRAVTEEALSVNEEYQSTNEELLTSKEELQSLNEELTALNSQLQETLDRQRTTSDDLQNILYSTDVATLFLDRDLGIRFFTPATRALFNVIPGDIGRPLADLHSLATDTLLPADAQAVLHDLQPVEREVETPGGTWFRRRILPYRTAGGRAGPPGGGVEGVVITFNDITRRKQAAEALEEAKQAAEAANLAKSRFLAAASHDLRQPLQTLALLQGLMVRAVTATAGGAAGEAKATGLVQRMDETLGAMSGMLDTLLDINQIEAGVVRAELADVPVRGLLDRMRDEFTYHAQAKGLALRVMPCTATIRTDPRLLEQMLRNLISNALKYTRTGRVLVGCRRHAGTLSIEVWDTGIGIPAAELGAVFDEYHQVGNEARERGRGLGLGLSIVQRLGKLLEHPVRVRSRPGRGSVFIVDAPRIPEPALPPGVPGNGAQNTAEHTAEHTGGHTGGNGTGNGVQSAASAASRRTGSILVIEDDPDLRDLLQQMLQADGHGVTSVPDGPAAVQAVQGGARPGLVLADYNLPGGMNGLQAVAALRQATRGAPTGIPPSAAPAADTPAADTPAADMPAAGACPAIILTGDISAATLHAIAGQGCMHLSKPVKPHGLMAAIQALLAGRLTPKAEVPSMAAQDGPVIFVVDDDAGIRAAVRAVLEEEGHLVEDYRDGEAFLAAYGAGRPGRDACLLVDAAMPGMDGLEVLRRLADAGHHLPAILITGHGDVPMAVRAMKAGALDFIEKPVRAPDLLAGVALALGQSHDAGALSARHAEAAGSIAGLTVRQRDVMAMVLAGQPSKNIAADLGISQRTVENHRAAIMQKTGMRSLPALARLALAAEQSHP